MINSGNPNNTQKSNASTSTNNNTNTLINNVKSFINNTPNNNNINKNNINQFITNFKTFQNNCNSKLQKLTTKINNLDANYKNKKGSLSNTNKDKTTRAYKKIQQKVHEIGNDISDLNQSKQKLETLLATKTTNFKTKTSAYLQETFVNPLKMKKEELTQMVNTLQGLTTTLKNTLGKNDELSQNNINSITKAYQNFTTSKNKITTNLENISLKDQFITLQTNLGTLGVNLKNTTNAFGNFNKFVANTKQKLATNKNNVNSVFNTRIQTINASIEKKTAALTPILEKIQRQIEELKTLTDNKTLNKAITDPLNQLIEQMRKTIDTMNGETKEQQQQLTKMMSSLKNIIGQPMNSVPRTLSNSSSETLNTSLVVQPSQNMVFKKIPVIVQENANTKTNKANNNNITTIISNGQKEVIGNSGQNKTIQPLNKQKKAIKEKANANRISGNKKSKLNNIKKYITSTKTPPISLRGLKNNNIMSIYNKAFNNTSHK